MHSVSNYWSTFLDIAQLVRFNSTPTRTPIIRIISLTHMYLIHQLHGNSLYNTVLMILPYTDVRGSVP